MTNMDNELWRFETARFAVVCTAEVGDDLDLSWDDTGEVRERIESGLYVMFCAKVAVLLDGREIAADYLGQCIYESGREFVTSHRDPDPMNRNCTLMRAARGGQGAIGHYFPDMVSIAVKEAREALIDQPTMRDQPLSGAVYTLDGKQPAIFTAIAGRDVYQATHADTGKPLGTYPGPVTRRKIAEGDCLMSC